MAVGGVGGSGGSKSGGAADAGKSGGAAKSDSAGKSSSAGSKDVGHSKADSFASGSSKAAADVAEAAQSAVQQAQTEVDEQAAADLAAARSLANTRAPAASGKLQGEQLTPDQAVELSQELDSMSTMERRVAKGRIADTFVKDPKALDKILEDGTPEEKKAIAMATMEGFTRAARKNQGFATLENFGRITKMAEAIDPKAPSKDIARALRGEYYSNEQLQVGPINLGKNKANINQDLRGVLDRVDLKRDWQEITGPDGKKMDVAHSLVALDAYAQQPGVAGYLKSQLFTDVGDAASQVFSWAGQKGAGDFNKVDLRGNNYGDQLRSRFAQTPDAKLSDLLR